MSAQPSNRADAPPHLSPPPRPSPVSWRLVTRVLGIATAVALFFALIGPFGSAAVPLPRRILLSIPYGWAGGLVGLTSVRLTHRLGLWRRGYLVTGLASGALMIPPMTGLVLMVVRLVDGQWLGRGDWPEALWEISVLCIAMSYLSLAFAWRRVPPPPPDEAPKFFERIPLKLRGGELWAVEAQDHYLRLHTSKGQDLILMRLSDAVDELAGVEGAQVHRSWWVAREAIAEAERGDGRATLTLKDGAQVPVSRTYARMLRERKWI